MRVSTGPRPIFIDNAQLAFLNFNAFFENTMFHDVAHGLGIKNIVCEGRAMLSHAPLCFTN